MQKHDKIATRLSLILTKLNSGEKLSIEALATEFNVTTRTIQRDLNERFCDIPIKKENKLYFLDNHYLGKLNFNDIKNFAMLSGIRKLFPSFGEDFLQKILDTEASQPYLVKGHNYENIESKTKEFQLIEKAINSSTVMELVYRDQKRKVHPYKFANVKGIWYLVALQGEIIKTFTFTKISHLKLTDTPFIINPEILKTIEDEETIWFSNTKTEVILKVESSIAEYFKRRKVIAYQKILEEFADGGLLVSTQMTFEEEVLQFVRYWIPNIRIISPVTLQEKLEESLKKYLE